MRRAETLKTDAAFRRNICRLRRAWNRAYPEYALGDQGWMPDPVPNYRLICLPPALAREHDALVQAGDDIRQNWKVFVRWRRLVLLLCDWGWPPAYYPNWLGTGAHPAVLFVSGALIWRLESVPSALIVTGGPTAFPLLFDPDDEMTHPGAAFWYAHSRHVVASLRDAIIAGDHIDFAWLDRVTAGALRAAYTERQARLDAGQEQPFWYVKIFPGITTSDRDELMTSVMEAAAYRYGDHPLRSPATELAARGKNVSQIADLLGVDRATVRRLLKAS